MNSVCGWLTHLELGKERWILESAGWQWELRVWREGEIVKREERCGHRVYLRSLLRKEKLFFLKVVKKDSQRSDQHNPEEQVSR